MKLKKELAILLVMVLLCGLLPASALADTQAPTEIGTWADLYDALLQPGKVSVVLTADVTAPEVGAVRLTVNEGTDAALDLNGHRIDGTYAIEPDMAEEGATIVISLEGGDLTVTDGSAAGTGEIYGANYGVAVGGGGTFTMTGGTICGQEFYFCGFYGELIKGGACVSVVPDGTFRLGGDALLTGSMDGVMMDGGSFEMSGGRISGSEAYKVDADTIAGGCGVEMYGGAFTMTGGVICGNDGDGVALIQNAAFTMEGGAISDSGMGGVWISDNGAFTMTGGVISGNRQDGVWILGSDAVFEMTGGVISGNRLDGVWVSGSDAVFEMTGGVIADNDVGVWISEPTGVFSMTDGEDGNYGVISSNNASGVIVEAGEFRFGGGAIIENPYGIEVWDDGTLRLSGDTDLRSDGAWDIRIPNEGVHLVFDDDPDGDHNNLTPIRLAVEDLTAADVPFCFTEGLEEGGYLLSFISADPAYCIVEAENGEAELRAVSAVGTWAELAAAMQIEGGVRLSANITAVAGDEALTIPANTLVTLDLAGHTLDTRAAGDVGVSLSTISALVLTDSASGEEPGVLLAAACGVDLVPDSCLIVNGGVIRAEGGTDDEGVPWGTAVYVDVNSNCCLLDGTLTALSCGADVSGDIEMTGGEITGCGDGVYLHGSTDGEARVFAAFWMTGGKIHDNSGDGVWLRDGGLFRMDGGCICDIQCGDGVFLHGGYFEMTGGEICGCDGILWEDGYYYNGRAVDMVGGKAVFSGGELHDCNAGIFLGGDAVVTMTGATIRDMKEYYSEDDDFYFGGHGVWCCGGELTMTGGEIADCESEGICLMLDGSAAVSGGRILSSGWAGIGLEDATCGLTLSGAPEFGTGEAANAEGDILLLDGNVITVSGALELERPISVKTKPLPAAGKSVRLTSGLSGHGEATACFVSSKEGYTVKRNGAGEAILANDEPAPEPDYGGGETATPGKDETKPAEAGPVTFTDVSDADWYASAADYAAETGLFEGVVAEGAEVAFEPEAEMNRGEAIRVLWNLAGKPPMEGMMPFDDVEPGSFYASAAGWAGNAGIVNGTGEGFDPDGPITREQFATMVYRFLQLSGRGFEGLWAFPLDFTDASEVSDWAREGMSWLVMNGIIEGMGDGTLNPQGVLTRAQTAALLQRVADLLEAES